MAKLMRFHESHIGVRPDRVELLAKVRAGDRVTVLVFAGQGMRGKEYRTKSGIAVMPSAEGGWVLDGGGRHGTPVLAHAANIVAVRKFRNKTPRPLS